MFINFNRSNESFSLCFRTIFEGFRTNTRSQIELEKSLLVMKVSRWYIHCHQFSSNLTPLLFTSHLSICSLIEWKGTVDWTRALCSRRVDISRWRSSVWTEIAVLRHRFVPTHWKTKNYFLPLLRCDREELSGPDVLPWQKYQFIVAWMSLGDLVVTSGPDRWGSDKPICDTTEWVWLCMWV